VLFAAFLWLAGVFAFCLTMRNIHEAKDSNDNDMAEGLLYKNLPS